MVAHARIDHRAPRAARRRGGARPIAPARQPPRAEASTTVLGSRAWECSRRWARPSWSSSPTAFELGGGARVSRRSPAGTINSNFELDRPSGSRYFVRDQRGQGRGRRRVGSAAGQRARRAPACDTPPPLVANDRAAVRADRAHAAARQMGERVSVARGRRTSRPTRSRRTHAEQFGAALARAPRRRARAADRRGGAAASTITTHLVARFERCRASTTRRSPRAIAILREELAVARDAARDPPRRDPRA